MALPPRHTPEWIELLEALYAAETPAVTSDQAVAGELFIEMERHVTECVACQIVDTAHTAAIERKDWLRAQDLARKFCPPMNDLSERFYAAMEKAFGDRST